MTTHSNQRTLKPNNKKSFWKNSSFFLSLTLMGFLYRLYRFEETTGHDRRNHTKIVQSKLKVVRLIGNRSVETSDNLHKNMGGNIKRPNWSDLCVLFRFWRFYVVLLNFNMIFTIRKCHRETEIPAKWFEYFTRHWID